MTTKRFINSRYRDAGAALLLPYLLKAASSLATSRGGPALPFLIGDPVYKTSLSTADLRSFRSCRTAFFATPLNSNPIGIDMNLATIPCGWES